MTKAGGSYTYSYNPSSTIGLYKSYIGAISGYLNQVMTRTNDTGQVNFTTLSAVPTSYGQNYEVFGFSDTLQSTKPIYIRFDYMHIANTTSMIYASIGTTTDGAGNVGGTTVFGNTLTDALPGSSTFVRYCYVSSDASQLVLLFGLQQPTVTATADSLAALVVERTRDADGTPNGNGFMVYRWQQLAEGPATVGATNNFMGVLARTFDTTTSIQAPTSYDLAAFAPGSGSNASFFNGTTTTAYPVYGYLPNGTPQGASKAIMVGYNADMPLKTVQTLTHYGTPMQFIPMGIHQAVASSVMTTNTTASVRTNLSPLFRWE